MEESEQSESRDQSNHDLRLLYDSTSITESACTSSNLDSEGDGIAEPFFTSGASSTPPAESDDDERLHNSNCWSKSFYYFGS